MQKTLSTLLWIKGREKANEYSGSHTPPKGFKQEPHIRGFFCLYYPVHEVHSAKANME